MSRLVVGPALEVPPNNQEEEGEESDLFPGDPHDSDRGCQP